MGTASVLPWAKCVLGCDVPPDREVLMLPCLHVFCSSVCLEKCTAEMEKKDSKPFCKTCLRKFTQDQIKKNVKLDSFLLKKAQIDDIVLVCGSCILDDPIASYCVECNQTLCTACTAFHPRLRGKQGHHLEKDLEKWKLTEFEILKNKRNQCDSESDENVAIYYCYDCQKKLCEACKISHDDSSVSNHVVVVITEEMAAIQSRINGTKGVRGIIDLGISKLEDKQKSMKEVEWDAFVEDLNGLVFKVLVLLQNRYKALLHEGVKQNLLKTKIIENKIKLLQRAKQDSTSLLQVLQDVNENLDNIGVINVARTALPQLDTQNKIKQSLEENFDVFVEKDSTVTLKDGILPELETIFQNLGLVDADGKPPKTIPYSELSPPAEVHHVGSMPAASMTPASTAKMTLPNPGTSPSKRGIAMKSTGGRLNSRPLGMPHLRRFGAQSLDYQTSSSAVASSSLSSPKEMNSPANRDAVAGKAPTSGRGEEQMDVDFDESSKISVRSGSSCSTATEIMDPNSPALQKNGVDSKDEEMTNGQAEKKGDESQAEMTNGNKIMSRSASTSTTSSSHSDSSAKSPTRSKDVCSEKRERKQRMYPDHINPDDVDVNVDESPKPGKVGRRRRPSMRGKSTKRVRLEKRASNSEDDGTDFLPSASERDSGSESGRRQSLRNKRNVVGSTSGAGSSVPK